MKVSIIIRCLNEAKFIDQLFQGIQAQTYQEFEIIVVDSGSTDNTLEICKNYDVQIIKIQPQDFSFGYALNIGCEEATGDILLFASAHVYPVYKNWIQQIITSFDQNKNIVLVYGRQIGNDITKYSEKRLFQKWFPTTSDYNQLHPFCNNANCAIRKSTWKNIPYNESLTGLEDLDWAKKILDKGFKIVYNSQATIVHVHEETANRIFNRYKREAIAIKSIFPHQSFNLFDFIRMFVGNTLSDYYHAIIDKQFFINILDIPIFRLNQFWGTYQGYKHHGIINNQLRNRFYYPNNLSREKPNEENSQLEIEYNE